MITYPENKENSAKHPVHLLQNYNDMKVLEKYIISNYIRYENWNHDIKTLAKSCPFIVKYGVCSRDYRERFYIMYYVMRYGDMNTFLKYFMDSTFPSILQSAPIFEKTCMIDAIIRYGNLPFIIYLLESGKLELEEFTRSRRLVISGNMELIKYFIERGRTLYNDDFLCAIRNNHTHVVDYMLENGFEIQDNHIENSIGTSSPHMIVHLGNHKKRKSVKLPSRMLKEVLNRNLFWKVNYWDEIFEILEYLLLKKGVRSYVGFVMSKLFKQNTYMPLEYRYNNEDKMLEIMQLFMENCSTRISTKELSDTLRNASRYGFLSSVKYLHEKGADIHADDDFALRWAVRNNHTEIIRYLIEHGANIQAKNGEVFEHAMRNKNIDMLRLLFVSEYKSGLS